ncbi:protein kinase [Streptomyces sp. NPDC006510]|uniref:serine/threonine-protein kinase n=1 Tax=Streptomyces sp. NPDC006510 TaxID=3155600 RepID=UPI0033AEC9F9
MRGGAEEESRLLGSGATPTEPDDPRRIGAFRLLGILGTGGMGRVYLGTSAGRYAAVKQVLPVLAADKDFLSHFGHELDNLAKLPAGVSARLLASDRTAQPPWFATEYIPGVTLSDALRLNGGPLPAESLWRLLRDGAGGLRAVHAAGMVHRDLKPSNVMLTLDGVSLIDFGVARAADQSRVTRTGMVIGTPAYMAPEQAMAERDLTGAADVFALAGLLLFAANCRPPFGDGSGPGLFYRIVHTDPDLGRLPDIDPDLAAVVESCLAKDAADRPTADQLFEIADGHVPAAASAPWPPAVTERITERAAFAAKPPPAEEPEPEPVAPVPAGPSLPDVRTTGVPEKPRRRRSRVLLIALPVVVVTGTTLTLALGPYQIGGSRGADSDVAAPSVTVGPSGSAADGRSTDPEASPSRSSGSGPGSKSASPDGSADEPKDGNGGKDGKGGSDGAGGSGSGGSGGSDGSGPSDGSGSGGTKPSGGSGSGGSGGSGGGGQIPAPSGQYYLKNASNKRCLGESASPYGGSMLMNSVCGEPAHNGATLYYKWTYKPTSGGRFKLVGQGTGNCLRLNGPAGLSAETCNASESQVWRIGAKTSSGHTLVNVAEGVCLQMFSSIGFQAVACNPSEPAQLWRNS